MKFPKVSPVYAYLIWSLTCCHAAIAETDSRILGTGGVSQIEGTGGGGINPWTMLSGYASEEEFSLTAFLTHSTVDDFSLLSGGAVFTWDNRIELSYARQDFELDTLGGDLRQDVYGLKVRLFGDILYHDWGQISAGLQYKRQQNFDLPTAVGAQNDTGIDYYFSVGKVFLAGVGGRNLFLNGTVRATKANQTGLLGFGGDQNDDYELVFEGTMAAFLNRYWAVGTEYRQKPDNLGFAREDDWLDVFVAWFPNKHLSLTAAYVDFGDIAGFENQTGVYFSLQGTF